MKLTLLYVSINFDSCLESNKVCMRQHACSSRSLNTDAPCLWSTLPPAATALALQGRFSPKPWLSRGRRLGHSAILTSLLSLLFSREPPVAVSVPAASPALTSSSLLHLHARLRSVRVSPDLPAPDGVTGSRALLCHHSLLFPLCLFSYCPSTCCLNSFKL